MTLHTLVPFCLVLALHGCFDGELITPAQPVDQIPDAEYSVLSTIVATYLQPSDSVQLFFDSTINGPYIGPRDTNRSVDRTIAGLLEGLRYSAPWLERETARDFTVKNLTTTLIMTPSKIHRNCLPASFQGSSVPNDLKVSRVGFDSFATQALAFVEVSRSGRIDGVYYVLAYQNGKWVVTGSRMIYQD